MLALIARGGAKHAALGRREGSLSKLGSSRASRASSCSPQGVFAEAKPRQKHCLSLCSSNAHTVRYAALVQIQSACFEFGRKTEGADRELFRLLRTEEADWSEFRLTLTLSLLVLGVLVDDHDFALALDDLALFAHGLHGRSDFH